MLRATWVVIRLALHPLGIIPALKDWGDLLIPGLLAALAGGGVLTAYVGSPVGWIAFNGIIAGLFCLAGIRLQLKIDDAESKQPEIVFMHGDMAVANLWRQKQPVPQDKEMDKGDQTGHGVFMLYVFIKNDPSGFRGEERTARKAAATVEVFDVVDLSNRYLSYWGVWRQNPQPATRPSHVGIEDLPEFDLPPNGLPHRLHFALKHPEDDAMYGHATDSQRYVGDGRDEQLKYKSRISYIKVGLKAINLKGHPYAWCKIAHGGPNTKPSIERVAEQTVKQLAR